MIIGICDDIPEYVNQLTQYVNNYFWDLNIKPKVMAFSSGKELLECKDEIDILFLDIELGDYNALNLVKDYRSKYRNTLLIIVTSYEQYLDDAMDLDILRYIDKPLEKERIFVALDRAVERINNGKICICDKSNHIYHIKKRDIIYIESYLKRVYIYTNNDTIVANISLKDLKEKILSTLYFACPHNSYVVNLNYLKLYSRAKIIINVGNKTVDIPVSSRHQTDFRKAYLNYMKEGYCNV